MSQLILFIVIYTICCFLLGVAFGSWSDEKKVPPEPTLENWKDQW